METSSQGSFSAALQKYFTRKGNRIVFSNGMSLNELALTMWERLGYRSVDPSVLSRVLSGERVFTVSQLESFTKIIRIPSTDANKLKEALVLQIANRFGIDDYIFDMQNADRGEILDENIQKIFQVLEEGGAPYLALDWCSVLEERLEVEIKEAKNEKDRNFLLKYLSKVISHKTNVFSHIQGARRFYETVLAESSRMREIAKLTKERSILGLAETRLSSALYILGDNLRSIKLARRSLEDDPPKENEMLALRESAICYSKLKENREFLSIRRRLLTQITQYSWYHKFEVYEGLARAEANLGNITTAYKNLNFASEALSKCFGTMRKVQYIAAELEIANLSKTKSAKDYFEKIGKEGLFLTREHGYLRHEQKIRKYLVDILN